jgi:hypothetical protein
MTAQIFISYRREDTADITGRIYDRLTYKYGMPAVFKDVDSIPLGTDYRKYLNSKIEECSVALVVIGDDWMKEDPPKSGRIRLDNPKDYVRIEVELALSRGIPVIPVLVEGAPLPPEERLPEKMKNLVYRQARVVGQDPDFRLHMDALIAELERIFDSCQPRPRTQKQVRPTAPLRPAYQRPANSAPLPPAPASAWPRPARGGSPQQTTGAGTWLLLTFVITIVFVGIIFFLSLLANM